MGVVGRNVGLGDGIKDGLEVGCGDTGTAVGAGDGIDDGVVLGEGEGMSEGD